MASVLTQKYSIARHWKLVNLSVLVFKLGSLSAEVICFVAPNLMKQD